MIGGMYVTQITGMVTGTLLTTTIPTTKNLGIGIDTSFSMPISFSQEVLEHIT